MEKVTKSALLKMHPDDIRGFWVPDSEALNTARVTICLASDSCKKAEGVLKYEGKRDGDIMIVRAIPTSNK